MDYFKVHVYSDVGHTEILIDKDHFTVGRSSKADVRLEMRGLSRVHLFVAWKKGKVWLKDNSSINGTYVNGEKIPANSAFEYDGESSIFFGKSKDFLIIESLEGKTIVGPEPMEEDNPESAIDYSVDEKFEGKMDEFASNPFFDLPELDKNAPAIDIADVEDAVDEARSFSQIHELSKEDQEELVKHRTTVEKEIEIKKNNELEMAEVEEADTVMTEEQLVVSNAERKDITAPIPVNVQEFEEFVPKIDPDNNNIDMFEEQLDKISKIEGKISHIDDIVGSKMTNIFDKFRKELDSQNSANVLDSKVLNAIAELSSKLDFMSERITEKVLNGIQGRAPEEVGDTGSVEKETELRLKLKTLGADYKKLQDTYDMQLKKIEMAEETTSAEINLKKAKTELELKELEASKAKLASEIEILNLEKEKIYLDLSEQKQKKLA